MEKLDIDSPPGRAISRRALLAGAAAAALVPPATTAVARPGRVFIAGGLRGDNALLGLIDRNGEAREVIALDGRAHSVAALRRKGEVIAVARRSDRWAIAIDPARPEGAVTIRPGEGHTLSGHVAVSPDGALAAFVEIRAADAAGFLSVREVGAGWREVARLASAGIGPHMALWLDDRHIAVANGGYYDVGAVKSPDGGIGASLAVIDRMTGRPAALALTGAAYADYSLRHIAAAPEGLAVVLQRIGKSRADTSPAALWRGGALEPLPIPPQAADPLRGFCGDVAVAGGCVLVTSRRADVVGAWRLGDRAWLGAVALPEAGSLVVDDDGTCYAATEDGTLAGIAVEPGLAIGWRQRAPFGWDNHGALL